MGRARRARRSCSSRRPRSLGITVVASVVGWLVGTGAGALLARHLGSAGTLAVAHSIAHRPHARDRARPRAPDGGRDARRAASRRGRVRRPARSPSPTSLRSARSRPCCSRSRAARPTRRRLQQRRHRRRCSSCCRRSCCSSSRSSQRGCSRPLLRALEWAARRAPTVGARRAPLARALAGRGGAHRRLLRAQRRHRASSRSRTARRSSQGEREQARYAVPAPYVLQEDLDAGSSPSSRRRRRAFAAARRVLRDSGYVSGGGGRDFTLLALPARALAAHRRLARRLLVAVAGRARARCSRRRQPPLRGIASRRLPHAHAAGSRSTGDRIGVAAVVENRAATSRRSTLGEHGAGTHTSRRRSRRRRAAGASSRSGSRFP